MDKLTTTQADRDAAVGLIRLLYSAPTTMECVEIDVTRAFARHRLSSEQSTAREVERLTEESLRFKRYWTQERERGEKLQNDNIALSGEVEQLRAQVERARDTAEMPEVAAMRYIEQLRAEEGDSVTILCDDPEAESADRRLAIDCNGAWTDWRERRFYGESVLQCLALAVTARTYLTGATK
jgi:hypothetical protein